MLTIYYGRSGGGKTHHMKKEMIGIRSSELFHGTRVFVDDARELDSDWNNLVEKQMVQQLEYATKDNQLMYSDKDVFVFDSNEMRSEEERSTLLSQILELATTNRVYVSVIAYERELFPLFTRADQVIYLNATKEDIICIPDSILDRKNKQTIFSVGPNHPALQERGHDVKVLTSDEDMYQSSKCI